MQKLEKPKFKHNKKRNTAFLFETLIKELTKASVNDEKEKTKLIASLLKEHFKKNGILNRELTLYKQIYETKQFPKEHAEKLLKEVRDEYEKIDEQEVFTEQSKLIAKLNKFFGPVVYDNFIPNYKVLASVSQLFNKNVEPKKKVILESELLSFITENEQEKVNLETVDSIVMKRFIEKFNETYSKTLLPEQKELLSKYISSGEDYIDLKVYLNEEFTRLKKELISIKNESIVQANEDINSKVNKLIESLSNFKFETINEQLIKKTMIIQEFIQEVKK